MNPSYYFTYEIFIINKLYTYRYRCNSREQRFVTLWPYDHNYDFVIKNCYRYLSSFIGEKQAEIEWLVSKIDDKIEAVEQLAEITKFVQHLAYARMQLIKL